MPTFPTRGNALFGVPGPHTLGKRFVPGPRGATNFTVAGVARDASANPLGGVECRLFRRGDHSLVATTTADGSGNYSFTISNNAGNFYVVFYIAGSPDRVGVSQQNLVAV